MKYPVLAVALLFVNIPSIAQDAPDKKGSSKVTIQIVEEKNGDRIVEERSYEVSQLSSDQRQAHLDSLLGALSEENNGRKRSFTVTMEDGDSKKEISRRGESREFAFVPEKRWEAFSDHNILHKFELDQMGKKIDSTIAKTTARVEVKMNRLLADLESRPVDIDMDLHNRLEKVRAFSVESHFNNMSNSSKTVRGVSINPNRPFDGMLNVRFSTKEKGDVHITVTDTRGKEQGKKELKDFEGDFVGQIKLKEAAKGVLFVNIVQNEDGVSQRVALPAGE